ncbi:ornithine cyclodeaminase [Bryobacterales bacterium F-183]|nr:ornithine cyclodeaminase [Bryobacterales bacterium F-183]
MPILLKESEVHHLLPMQELIGVMEDALAAFAAGVVDQPVRSVVQIGEEKNYFGTMPAGLPNAVGAKLVTVFHSNVAKGLTSHLATILLLDPETGALQALLDGRYITEARTAAVSAVSTKYLAREDAKTLAILGSGVQARSHVEALRLVRDFQTIKAYSPNRGNLERFCEETGVTPCNSAEEAVRGADVVAAVSAAREPIVQSEWVSDGTHLIGVGACRPTHREFTADLMARSSIYVDSIPGAMKEAGDILMAIADCAITAEHIRGELGAKPRRTSQQEVTFFKSLGMAVEDVAAANLVYQRAIQAGVGTPFELA